MSHILYSLGDHLWIGSKAAVANRISRLYDIDAFLALGQKPFLYPRVQNIHLLDPPPLDRIYRHIDQKRPGSLLLFSHDGISGAPEIAAGQLMRERDLTMRGALEIITRSQPNIRPDPLLLDQVEKWIELNNFLRESNNELWLQ